MADDFDFDVQSAAEVAQDVAITLADRERAAKGGGGAEAGARARTRLDELDRAVKRLEGALVELERSGVGAGGGAGGRALAARREAVRKLAIEAKRLREREHASAFAAGTDRDALLGSGNGRSYGRETELTRDMTTQEMVQHANVQIKAQDAVLDKMSRSLDTLKTMGGAIRDETALQMKLLDDTGDQIDQSNTGLVRETARVEHVTKEAGTCWLYMAICILLVVLIGLIVARWAP